MSKRLKKKKIKALAAETLRNIQIPLDFHLEKTNVNMIYDFIQNKLIIDVERLKKARKEMRMPVTLEAYVRALVLHETGHYMDRDALWESVPRTIEIHKKKREVPYFERAKDLKLFQLDIEEHEMDYTFEETAWRNAAMLNEKYGIVDKESFESVKFESLLSYTAVYNRDLLIYQKLLKEDTGKHLAV